jgi:predicted alpha/beta-hydrolase family hydrolase
MGGRVATRLVDSLAVAGGFALGYPFHPPGKPEKTRVAHLAALKKPILILQGERDSFGTPDDVAGYSLDERLRVEWLPDGDHSFTPRKRSGITPEQNMERAAAHLIEFARHFT